MARVNKSHGVGAVIVTGLLLVTTSSCSVEKADAPQQDKTTTSGAGVLDWSAVVDKVAPSSTTVTVRSTLGKGVISTGSGAILDTAGHVVTNNHVVAARNNEDVIWVTLADGREYEASITGADETNDLAVLAMKDLGDKSHLLPVEFASSEELKVGAPVVALGSPLGLSGTVTNGVVSAKYRSVSPRVGANSALQVISSLQTNAAINPGNSGGPLFDVNGKLVGINFSMASPSGATSSGNIGIGFAIPSDTVEWVVEDLKVGMTPKISWLGVQTEDGDKKSTETGTWHSGALVNEVVKDSAAQKAALTKGDLITRWGSAPVSGSKDLLGLVRSRKVGDKVSLGLVREGKLINVEVTLTEKPTG